MRIVDPVLEQAKGCSEALLRPALDVLPVAVYTTDLESRLVAYNAATEELWGRRPQQGGMSWQDAFALRWPDGSAMAREQTPGFVALTEQRSIRDVAAVVSRPDGTQVCVRVSAAPCYDATGLVGALTMLVEIGEQPRGAYFEQRLAAIVESSEDAIISKDLNGTIATWNRGAESLFGYAAEEVVGRPITLLIPDDHLAEEAMILDSIRNGKDVWRYETVRKRKDGTLIDVSLTISPLHDATGRIIGASKIARDITERKRAQERQDLLVREMGHRVKNVLAVASGLVALNAKTAKTPVEMAEAVRERLAAFARAHELTHRAIGTDGTMLPEMTVHALVRTIVAPYLDRRGGVPNIALTGTDTAICAEAATGLALVIHELSTNAVKHGALSRPDGRVEIACRVDGARFVIDWRERGGPALRNPPGQTGFGTRLATRIVNGQFAGALNANWREEGLELALEIPLDHLR